VERLERSTNGLKGRLRKTRSPIQCPAVFTRSSGRPDSLVHWMRLVRSCQHFDVQWIRFTLISASYTSRLDCTTLFSFLSSYRENLFIQGENCGIVPIRTSVYSSAVVKNTGEKGEKKCLTRLIAPKNTIQLTVFLVGCISILVPELYPLCPHNLKKKW
jgi:hypothetical protein